MTAAKEEESYFIKCIANHPEESDGLLDPENGDEFNLRLEQLSILSWQGDAKLVDYIKGKSDMMKNSMINEVRSRAGWGILQKILKFNILSDTETDFLLFVGTYLIIKNCFGLYTVKGPES